MKPVSLTSYIPGIAWFFVILYLVTMPSDKIPEPSGWWEWVKLIQFDKMVHMGIFAVQVTLFMYPVSRAPYSRQKKQHVFLLIAFAGAAWGVGTELIQKFFIPSRSFDKIDITADTIGVLIGFFFCRRFLLNRFSKAESKA